MSCLIKLGIIIDDAYLNTTKHIRSQFHPFTFQLHVYGLNVSHSTRKEHIEWSQKKQHCYANQRRYADGVVQENC